MSENEKKLIRQTSTEIEVGDLFQKVREILEAARHRVARSVNSEMVQAYWHIGQAIVEHEQHGKMRADYGEGLIKSLAKRLTDEGLKGFQTRNLWRMRDFYLKFPKVNALRSQLSWTHYRLLLKVESDAAREFNETETVAASWSTCELERQINSFFFERTAVSIEKRKMLEKGRETGEKYNPQDFIKDPFVLEFLGLKDVPELFKCFLPIQKRSIALQKGRQKTVCTSLLLGTVYFVWQLEMNITISERN